MTLQNAKGTRDSDPEEMILKNKVVNAITKVFELYGYVPLDTPILERADTLASKYAGGAEILKEMFVLKDQGQRELGLRYDLTVPLARYVGMNPDVKMPFKRYQIGAVFRDGPIKLGRYRQFMQCDADVVGSKYMEAEAELLSIAWRVFKELDVNARITVNNRKVLNGLLLASGVEKNKQERVIIALDKLQKVGEDAVRKELIELGVENAVVTALFDAVTKESLDAAEKIITDEEGKEGIAELNEVLSLVPAEIDFTLARGLNYYTGTVFEAFLKDSPITSSIAAGGRYDNMIGDFLQAPQKFPAAGISFGIDVLMDTLRGEGKKSTAQAFIIPIQAEERANAVATTLRDANINVAVDLMRRGVGKNLNYCNSMSIPFAIIIGNEEIRENKVKLRNMKTGDEELVDVEEAIGIINGTLD